MYFVILLVSVGVAVPSLEDRVANFILADSNVGSELLTITNSEWHSQTDLKLGGASISSNLTCRIVDGKLVSFTLIAEGPTGKGSVVAKEGKLTAEAGGQKREVDYQPATAWYSDLHPQVTHLFSVFDPGKGADQKIKILHLDSGSEIEAFATQKPPRSYTINGQKNVARVIQFRFATGVELTGYFDDKGTFIAFNVPSQRIRIVLRGHEDVVSDPTTKYPELSQPTFTPLIERGVKIPMRDGIELIADIARPNNTDRHPVILVRTPYNRSNAFIEGEWWAKRGYIFISQDVRGRFDSGGEWNPFFNERKDGFDTIEWIASQPWCDGNVGMIGGSYLGIVQWHAAVERPQALKCIVPQVSPPDLFFNIPWDHGIPMLLGAVWWAHLVSKPKDEPFSVSFALPNPSGISTLPLTKVDDATLGKDVAFFNEWMHKDTWSAYSGANFLTDISKVKIPVLLISGWWDGDGIGTKMAWERLRETKHEKRWLIYGPWTHAFNTTTRIGDIDYGPDAILELESLYLRWFDTWLKGKDVGLSKIPRARVFVTGINEWRDLSDWPEPDWKLMTLYFRSDGPANGLSSVGRLSDEKPKDELPDRYTYNPADIPTGEDFMKEVSMDPASATTKIEIKPYQNDVLIYKSNPLSEPLEIGGPIDIDLFFSTSAVDTDFFGALVDIAPDGTMRLIGIPGKIRAKYYRSFDKPTLLKPHQIYKLTLRHWDTAHHFAEGHRIGVIIRSSWFPAYARNLNTGEPAATGTRLVAAHQTIYHDWERPSCVRFRVLSKK